MNKETFKQSQPVVYQTLSNALKNNRLAHAYLLTGPKGSNKEEVALLFAQSLVCQHTDSDGFACQECDSCKRMANNESVDFHWIAPSNGSIKKQDIVQLQSWFETTSVETGGRRIYVLEAFDTATASSSNSLLKFIEEPAGEIYGILLADEKSGVLPTIQSRCQTIAFRPASTKEKEEIFRQWVDPESAQVLAQYGYSEQTVQEWAESEEFQAVKYAAQQYVQSWDSHETIFDMQTTVFVPRTALMNKQWVQLWVQWVYYCTKHHETGLSLQQQAKVQTILVEALDTLRIPVDLALFLDQLYSKIRKVVIE